MYVSVTVTAWATRLFLLSGGLWDVAGDVTPCVSVCVYVCVIFVGVCSVEALLGFWPAFAEVCLALSMFALPLTEEVGWRWRLVKMLCTFLRVRGG